MDAWWKKFSQDVFPLLVPRTKWQLEHPNLEAGAIVLVRYESKYGKDRFRLARVVDVRRDEDGRVRTAWVGLRNLRRAVREEADVCREGLTMSELPIQRLVMILPPQEQPQEVLEGLRALPPMPGRNAQAPARQQPGQAGRVAQQPVRVQVPDPAEEVLDLPRPQRPRGRPRRAL